MLQRLRDPVPTRSIITYLPRSPILPHKTLTVNPFLTIIQRKSYTTVSVVGLELLSSLEFGFPGALHLQSTVELVLQVTVKWG